MIPQTGEIYKHFKGNLYRIVTIAKDSETGEEMVVYQALYGDYDTYVRSLKMFTSPVDRDKYPDAAQEYRFERVDALNGMGAVSPAPQAADVSPAQTAASAPAPTEAGEAQTLPPLVEQFLDSDDCEEQLSILTAIEKTVTDRDIDIMSLNYDMEISKELDTGERFGQLREYIELRSKFQSSRLR